MTKLFLQQKAAHTLHENGIDPLTHNIRQRFFKKDTGEDCLLISGRSGGEYGPFISVCVNTSNEKGFFEISSSFKEICHRWGI